MQKVVIVGGGQAGAQCAFSLRQNGWEGAITILTDEPRSPYQRPPLSKAYLLGELAAEKLSARAPAQYESNNIEVRTNSSVARIDRVKHCVYTAGGDKLDYDFLVLATGSQVRKLDIPGAEFGNVLYLRTLADADRLASYLRPNSNICIVGAGYIGLEVAAAAAVMCCQVTVLESQDRVMKRVTGETVSRHYQQLHEDHGVKFIMDAQIHSLEGSGENATQVRLSDGTEISCDCIVVGVGIIPCTAVAEEAGLTVRDGILVNEYCQTEDPHIYAIGDCTRHFNKSLGQPVRLESVQNAMDQARAAASSICGKREPYNQVPWFWFQQYDSKLQTAGLSAGRYDRELLRGDPETGSFSVLYANADTIVAVDSINAPADHMAARKLVAMDQQPPIDNLLDPAVALKDSIAE